MITVRGLTLKTRKSKGLLIFSPQISSSLLSTASNFTHPRLGVKYPSILNFTLNNFSQEWKIYEILLFCCYDYCFGTNLSLHFEFSPSRILSSADSDSKMFLNQIPPPYFSKTQTWNTFLFLLAYHTAGETNTPWYLLWFLFFNRFSQQNLLTTNMDIECCSLPYSMSLHISSS